MLQATRRHTAGNRKRQVLNYNEWLEEGVTVASATVTSDSATCTVDDVTVVENYVIFFLNAGVANEELTLSLQMVDSKTGIKNDTVAVKVYAP